LEYYTKCIYFEYVIYLTIFVLDLLMPRVLNVNNAVYGPSDAPQHDSVHANAKKSNT